MFDMTYGLHIVSLGTFETVDFLQLKVSPQFSRLISSWSGVPSWESSLAALIGSRLRTEVCVNNVSDT